VRVVRIAAVIYVHTFGLPDHGLSSTCLDSTGVPGSHPSLLPELIDGVFGDPSICNYFKNRVSTIHLIHSLTACILCPMESPRFCLGPNCGRSSWPSSSSSSIVDKLEGEGGLESSGSRTSAHYQNQNHRYQQSDRSHLQLE
jgi:hypothetical protein